MNTSTNPSKQLQGFEGTVKDFWASRPRRPREGRKVAGVAAGVGDRYGIDPVIIRVAFAVLTVFGGIGLPLYLVGWLLFAEEGDEVSGVESLFGQGRSSMSKGFALVLCAVLVPMSGWAFFGNWINGGSFIGLALAVTGLYLMHRSRGQFNRPVPVNHTTGGRTMHDTDCVAATRGTPVTQAPLTWDALGADPRAWRLSNPEVPAPPPPSQGPAPRRRSKVGFATAGAALVVGGVGAALAVTGQPWFTPDHVIGLVLAVLACGMLLGSLVGGARGLLWLAIPLSLAGLAVSAVPMEQFRGGIGDVDAMPSTSAQVLPVYERTAGSIHVDLTQVTGDEPLTTAVRNGTGDITVVVPADADVTYTCEAQVGDLACFDQQRSGVRVPALKGVDLGDDGEGGRKIDLTVTTWMGNVEVHRG